MARSFFYTTMIRLIDALNQMEATDRNGRMIPFSLKFYTKEGYLIEINKGMKVAGVRNGKPYFDAHSKTEARIERNPNHFKNSTRNILIPESGKIRKAKIRLMTEFNGEKICY